MLLVLEVLWFLQSKVHLLQLPAFTLSFSKQLLRVLLSVQSTAHLQLLLFIAYRFHRRIAIGLC